MRKQNKLMSFIFTAILICTAMVSANFAQKCAEELKGKTYIGINEGKFDNFPSAAFAFKLTFNSKGDLGTARTLYAYESSGTNAKQEFYTFKCATADNGQSYFALTVGRTPNSAGSMFYKSFDNGSRLLLKSNIPNRDSLYWLFEVPAMPSDPFPK